MSIKIITLIAASITTVQALKSFNKGRFADAFSFGFAVLTLCKLARIYF
jgi:hypothetical protein